MTGDGQQGSGDGAGKRGRFWWFVAAACCAYTVTMYAVLGGGGTHPDTAEVLRLRRAVWELQPAAQMVPSLRSDLADAQGAYEKANDVAKKNYAAAEKLSAEAKALSRGSRRAALASDSGSSSSNTEQNDAGLDDIRGFAPSSVLSRGADYVRHRGFLQRGDVARGISSTFLVTSIRDAKSACSADPSCKGFTFSNEGLDGDVEDASDDVQVKAYFKTAFSLRNLPGWTAYRKHSSGGGGGAEGGGDGGAAQQRQADDQRDAEAD